MATTLEHLDSFKLAYEYIQKANLMSDSMQQATQTNQTLQIQFDYWFNNKEMSHVFEQKNNERTIFITKIGIALLLFGMCVLAYFLWQQYKLNKLIRIQKISIEERGEEIARQNEELIEKQEEILQQKKVILEKSNEQEQLIKRLKHNDSFLNDAIDKLIANEVLIQEKNKELEHYSKNLEQEVESRTQEVLEKNRELVQTVNQLEQFSYVLAHNLRAPVARLQGLILCFNMNDIDNPENPINIRIYQAVSTRLRLYH